MKRTLFYLFGATLMASPAAPTGCETVNVGVTYQGQYGDYTVSRSINNGRGNWNVLVSADGKKIIPLHR